MNITEFMGKLSYWFTAYKAYNEHNYFFIKNSLHPYLMEVVVSNNGEVTHFYVNELYRKNNSLYCHSGSDPISFNKWFDILDNKSKLYFINNFDVLGYIQKMYRDSSPILYSISYDFETMKITLD